MDNGSDSHELDLLLPQSVTRPLWKSLLSNLRDRLFPEKLPPLQLTSRPMNTGMLIGDAVSHTAHTTAPTPGALRNMPRPVGPTCKMSRA